MAQLPERMAAALQPRVNVIWWGRRAAFEIVEEVSEAIWWDWVLISLGLKIGQYFEFKFGWYVAVGLAVGLVSNYAVKEIYEWLNEVYVVTKDDLNGGGRVYKFYGWLNKRVIDEPITPSSPTIVEEYPVLNRLWGWITAEKMVKVLLKSQNHTFMEGKKISPNFVSAIKKVRGTPKGNIELGPNDLNNLTILDQVRLTGLIPLRKARQAALAMIDRKFFGE